MARQIIKSDELFAPQSGKRETIATAGKQSSIDKAKAYIERGFRDYVFIAERCYQTRNRNPITQKPLHTEQFLRFQDDVRALVDEAIANDRAIHDNGKRKPATKAK